MKMACGGVSAETLYDVLHDGSYRRKWDSNMMDAYDIGRLTANADVGYYSCEPPSNAARTPGTVTFARDPPGLHFYHV